MMLALLLIVILAALLFFSLFPYINAFFGAFILFVIFRPLYRFLKGEKKRRLGKRFAAFSVIILSIVSVLIPLYFLLSTILGEAQVLLGDKESLNWLLNEFELFISHLFARFGGNQLLLEARFEAKLIEFISEALNFISRFLLGSIQGLGKQFVSLTIMYFLLYYLFVGEDSGFMKKISAAIPFNEENTQILLTEFKNVVRTTLIASGAIAFVQGSILALTFLIFNIEGAFLWGSIAAILSFLPVVGASFIWIPAGLIQLLQQDYLAGIGVFVSGLIISTIDNFLRPIIQKKVGAMHPFESLLGIIIGVSLFGLIGIVIGPLLLSYFILTVKMFNEEYLSNPELGSKKKN